MNDQKYKNELHRLDPYIELNKKGECGRVDDGWMFGGWLFPCSASCLTVGFDCTEIKKNLDSMFESYVDDIREKISNMQMFDKSNEGEGL